MEPDRRGDGLGDREAALTGRQAPPGRDLVDQCTGGPLGLELSQIKHILKTDHEALEDTRQLLKSSEQAKPAGQCGIV